MAKGARASPASARTPTTPHSQQTTPRPRTTFTIDIPIPTTAPQQRQQQQAQTSRPPSSPYPPYRERLPGLTARLPRNQQSSSSSSQGRSTGGNNQRQSPSAAQGSRNNNARTRTEVASVVNTPSSSRNATFSPRRPTQTTSGLTGSGTSHQSAAEITDQQSFPTQLANPPLTDLLASIGNVEAMLASWESESRDTDETIRQLYAQEANLRSGSRSTSSVLSPSSSSSPSSPRATPFSATLQSSTTNTDTNKAGNRGSMRKKASDETITSSIAFHNSERARARVNLFEKVPTEVLCVILGWVVEPIGEKMSATDDGDGIRIGNPLLYWHLNPDRTLLRLVCRSWNQTIVAMAREIHVKLGSDESMVKLLETEERRRSRPVTLTRTTAIQGRIGGARLPHLSLAIRNAYSNSLSRSNIPRPQSELQRQQPNLLQQQLQQLQQQPPLRRSARLSQVTQHTTSSTTPSSSSLSTPTRTTPRSQAASADWEPSFTYIHTRTTRVSQSFKSTAWCCLLIFILTN